MTRIPALLHDADLHALLQTALETGADSVHLRVGAWPFWVGHGRAGELYGRQLTRPDLERVADLALRHCRVPEQLATDDSDAAIAFPLLWEWPEQAVFELRLGREAGSLTVDVEIARPWPGGPADGI